MGASLEQRQAWRYAILRKMYDLSGGHHLRGMSFASVAKEVGVPEEERAPARQYLMGEGLIRYIAQDVAITHAGVVEIEKSMTEPTKPTEHFTPAVIQQVTQNFSGPVGAVQTGSHNVAHVNQSVSTDVQVLLQQLRAQVDGLPAEQREEAIELVHGLEEQAKKPSPSKAMIKQILAGLGGMFAGAGSDVVAEIGKKLLGL